MAPDLDIYCHAARKDRLLLKYSTALSGKRTVLVLGRQETRKLLSMGETLEALEWER